MPKMKYWDSVLGQWVTLNAANADTLGGELPAHYAKQSDMDAAEGRLDAAEAKIGTAALTTTATDLSAAVNELLVAVNAVDLTALIDDDALDTASAWSAAKIIEQLALKINATEKAAAGGVATLNAEGLVPLAQLPAEVKETKVVADIDARDAIAEKYESLFVFVIDATDDPTVNDGGALYVYDGTAWVKVSETESMDLTFEWDAIENKPTSAVADIDDAVAKRHEHANKTQLNKIAEDGEGDMTYNGAKLTKKATTDALEGRVGTAEGNITRIDGDDATVGSFRKAIADAVTAFDNANDIELDKKADKVTGGGTEGKLAALDATGNLTNSTIAADNVATVAIGTAAPDETKFTFWVDTTA